MSNRANTLMELAERVEKATGPDRELDPRIWCALRKVEFPEPPYEALVPDYDEDPTGGVMVESITRNGLLLQCRRDQSPRYTASLDAAMMLVPEGWSRGQWGVIGKPDTARLWRDEHDIVVSAATPALALTAASLKALAASEDGK